MFSNPSQIIERNANGGFCISTNPLFFFHFKLHSFPSKNVKAKSSGKYCFLRYNLLHLALFATALCWEYMLYWLSDTALHHILQELLLFLLLEQWLQGFGFIKQACLSPAGGPLVTAQFHSVVFHDLSLFCHCSFAQYCDNLHRPWILSRVKCYLLPVGGEVENG